MLGRYDGSFIRLKGMKHIVVTGHITYGNLVAFANEFYSKRNRNLYKMVVLLKDYPSRELELLARTKFYQRIYFYKGTPLVRTIYVITCIFVNNLTAPQRFDAHSR